MELYLRNPPSCPSKNKNYRSITLIPSSTLQEYLLRYSILPKGKELGDVLYKVLASGNPVFNEEVLDDWGTSLDELQKTVPQLFDASKKVNGFIFGLVRNNRVAGRIVQGYHNTTMSNFVYNVNATMKQYKEMGVSSTLLSSRRVFLGYLNFTSRQVISFIDDMFMKEVSVMVREMHIMTEKMAKPDTKLAYALANNEIAATIEKNKQLTQFSLNYYNQVH